MNLAQVLTNALPFTKGLLLVISRALIRLALPFLTFCLPSAPNAIGSSCHANHMLPQGVLENGDIGEESNH